MGWAAARHVDPRAIIALMMPALTKDEAARRLIEWHFRVEPYLREVYRMLAEDEDAQDEPIKLLEVNEATIATGAIEAFGFTPTDEIPFMTVIAEVTSDELAALRERPGAFPKGWSLSRAEHFQRPGQS
jgi:hypothetical protein